MARRPNVWAALVLLCGCSVLFALPPGPAEEGAVAEAKSQPAGPPTPPKKADAAHLPADAVILVTDQIADVLKQLPKYVVLTPDKYQEYLDAKAQLRALMEARKATQAPSSCLLKGRLDGNQIVLQAQFRFVTDAPNTVVNLACAPAFAGAGAQLDGHEPLLKVENGGFTVQVKEPGDHQLTLDLSLQVQARGDGRGFELELPRAAITEIDLELPNLKDVRRDKKPLTDMRQVFRDGRLKDVLGPADKLDLAWKDVGATTNVPVVPVAVAKVQVQVDDRETTTRADLTLKVEGGQTNVWQLLVPLGATLQIAKEDEARVRTIDQADKKFVSLRTIRLKEPGGEPLNVTVTVKGPAPRPGVAVPVGPFAVYTAPPRPGERPVPPRQSGTILVTGAPANQRLLFTRRGATEEQRPADDEHRPGANAFRYAGVSILTDNPQSGTGPASLSWLDVETEVVHGLLEAKVSHVVRLQRDETHGRFWHVKTTIDAQPVRPGADHLDIFLPPGCVYDDRVGPVPAALVSQVETDVALTTAGLAVGSSSAAAWPRFDTGSLPRVLRLKFAEQLKPFALTIEADYLAAANESGEATLLLPRPLGTPDRGGAVTVSVPDDAELLQPRPDNAALRLEQREPQLQVWRADRFPEQVRVHWQQHRPYVRATGVIDLTFGPHEIQVRHLLHFHFPGVVPAQVALLVPESLGNNVRLGGDGELTPADAADPRLRFAALRPSAGKDDSATLELEYSFPRPSPGEALTVPLVVPDQVAQGDTKVRVWGDLDAAPKLAPEKSGWSEQNIEVVADNPRLPVLVVLSHDPAAPLLLQMNAAQPGAAVLIDRALIRVSVGDTGQSYRASFLLTHLATRDMDVEFPAPVISLEPRGVLDLKEGGRKEFKFEPVDETGRRADGSRIGRVRLDPDLLHGPAVLEVSYHLPAGRTDAGLVQTTLQPPLIRGAAGRVQTRWLVALPSNLIVLGPEGGPGSEPTWGWQGWLPAPHVALTSTDLEHWFADGAEDKEPFVPSVVSMRNEPGALTVIHAPQQLWLLVCSLVLVASGLGLFLLLRPSADGTGSTATWVGVAAAVLMVLTVAVVVGRFLWPTLMAAVFYGCLPGLAVLVVAFVAHLLMQEHYRRQIVFLPSFTRGRSGSSIVRTNTGSTARPQPVSHPHGEPSTVDLPPPVSSQRPLGDVLRTEETGGSKRTN